MRSNQLISTARKLREYIETNASTLSDAQALEMPAAFPNWASGKSYEIGDRVRYGEKLYKCAQAHSAQADWTPDVVPALWVKVALPGEVAEWKQPTGAHDAYMKGDLVLYNGTTYCSTVDTNVWQPDSYGWEIFEG
jgi:hypothetical protein